MPYKTFLLQFYFAFKSCLLQNVIKVFIFFLLHYVKENIRGPGADFQSRGGPGPRGTDPSLMFTMFSVNPGTLLLIVRVFTTARLNYSANY